MENQLNVEPTIAVQFKFTQMIVTQFILRYATKTRWPPFFKIGFNTCAQKWN